MIKRQTFFQKIALKLFLNANGYDKAVSLEIGTVDDQILKGEHTIVLKVKLKN